MPRSGLLSGCALGALLATLPAVAEAQSFQGSYEVVTGNVFISETPDGGPGMPATTTFDVFESENVINWTTFDLAPGTPIDFQPEGTVATFQRDSSSDYTVLNRILPLNGNSEPTSAIVQLNGLVESFISGEQGGHIWFYSPTGIIAGPTSTFNVGSLILTTDDIGFVENCGPCEEYGTIYGPGGTIQFRGTKDAPTSVEIKAGAKINADGIGSYVALVAPRIVQAGSISANGNIAYIAAEEVDMTINAGLVDFTIVTGSTESVGIDHSGDTGGPASTDSADVQRIMLVAMPKNDAITMLLAGSLGYTPAATVVEEGSSIVLASGFVNADPSSAPSGIDGNIEIHNATFGNPLTAWAANNILVDPDFGTTSFNADATLNAAASIDMFVDPGDAILADANLTLTAGVPGQGGKITVRTNFSDAIASAPLLDVEGDFNLDADSEGILPIVEPVGDGTGGTITVSTNGGGRIEAANVFATADGEGYYDGFLGGIGQGGTIDFEVLLDGVIQASAVDLQANGFGGRSDNQGGDGNGGRVTITDNGGQLDFSSVNMGAFGGGGDGAGFAGDGLGGTAIVTINVQEQNWDFLSMDASAGAGGPTVESEGLTGNATGGEDGAILEINGPGSLSLTEDLTMLANSYQGVDGVEGFTGEAGRVNITADGGDLSVGGTLFAEATAQFGGRDGFAFTPDTSPTQIGGRVTITAQGGGRITAHDLSAFANAEGAPALDTAGTATGGEVTISALAGSTIRIDNDTGTSFAHIAADAFGGPGPAPAHAQGGIASIVIEDGDFSVSGDIEMSASGLVSGFFEPPLPGPGFNATGGTASIELREGDEGTANLAAGDLQMSAVGDARLFLEIGLFLLGGGDEPIVGDGGVGTGGFASLTMDVGSLTLDELVLDASGAGGTSAASSGATAFQSGDGFGTSSTFTLNGGIASVTTLELLANGFGGGGAAEASGSDLAALAGNGTGGSATMQLNGGELTVTDATLVANGYGGDGMGHFDDGDASDGGDGTGGTALLASSGDWTGLFSTSTLTLQGNGVGGAGGLSDPGSADPPLGSSGNGGDGTGNNATVSLVDGEFSLGQVHIEAFGSGGYSGDASSGLVDGAEGGGGFGGTAVFNLADNAGPVGARSVGELDMDSSGFGGFGSYFVAQGGAGSAELTVDVLDLTSELDFTGSLTIFSTGCCLPGGTGIQALISGAPLSVGGDILMVAGGPISVVAEEPLSADGIVVFDGLNVNTSGLIQSGDFMSIRGLFGINADRLTSGDTTDLQSPLGPIFVNDLLSTDLVTASGLSVEIHSSGGLGFISADATAGDLLIETVDNLTLQTLSATGSVTLQATSGDIGTGSFTAGTWAFVDAGGSVSLDDIGAALDVGVTARGGDLTVGDVTAGDEIWLSIFGTDPTRLLTAGNLVSTGLGDDDAAGPPVLFGDFPNGAGPSGNVIRVRSSGSVLTGNVETPGRAIIVADQGTMTLGDLSGNEALVLLGHGDIGLGSATTGGSFYVADSSMFLPYLPDAYDPASLDGVDPVSTTGSLTATGLIDAGSVSIAVGGDLLVPEMTSGDTTRLRAGGAVDIDNLLSVGTVALTAGSAQIHSTGPLTFTTAQAAGTMEIVAAGDLAFADVSAGSDLTLESTGGSLTATGAHSGGFTELLAGGDIAVDELLSAGPVTANGQNVDITSTGSLQFDEASASAGTMTIDTAGDLIMGQVNATEAIDLVSGGTFGLSGAAHSPLITVLSNDIDIGGEAELGLRGLTSSITLTSGEGANGMVIGDGVAAAEGAYVLDAGEASRLFADERIDIVAPGDIAIGDLALTFSDSGNIGTGGTLEITSPGSVLVTGNVDLTTSSEDDSFVIDPSLIAVDTATGSIAMRDTDGDAQGRLRLVGDDVIVATGSVIDQLDGMTDLDAITALLDQPGGEGDKLIAGKIEVSAINGFYVQNSGESDDFDDRRGIAAGSLDIETESDSTKIAINGRILTADGAVTGLDVAELVTINGEPAQAGGQFDPRSTINGCVIGSDCSFVPPPEPEPVLPDPPPSDELDPLIPVDPIVGIFVSPLIELADTDPLVKPPLVDEPITGVGNDDLWQPPCDPAVEDGPCPEGDAEP